MKKMNCQEFEKNMLAFHDKELDASTAARMEKHLHSCVACAQLYRQVTAAYHAFSEPEVAPAPDFESFYAETAAKASFTQEKPGLIFLNSIARAAAAVTLFAGLSAGIIAATHVLDTGAGTGTSQEEYYSSLATDFHLSTEQEYSVDSYLAEESSAEENE